MIDRPENQGTPGDENQRIGKELYNQDNKQNQQRYGGYRGPSQKSWDEGNFFHTGPSQRGAQDRNPQQHDYRRGGSSNSSYQQGNNAHLNDHYGSRQDSAYRNERNFLNHGDQGDHRDSRRQSDGNMLGSGSSSREGNMLGNAGGSRPGNFNEPPRNDENVHREGPGSRSRYKETDYRYGSGSHNWHREERYTPNEDRDHDNRGFFDKVRDGWNDIMHSDDPDYQQSNDRRHADEISSRKRFGSEPYQDRPYDNGYDRTRDRGVEGSGRWADETDSGDDDKYKDTDRNQRWRR